MDELAKKEIKKVIEWRSSEVINTKYIFEYIGNKNHNISKKDIEDFLVEEEYVHISDNYMIQKKGLIKYCNENQIFNLTEFKKHIFIDYGVPYITITESQFKEYLKYKPSKTEELVVEHLGKYYKINTVEDLVELGLESKYISFDLLETFCKINPDKPALGVGVKLEDRNIKLSSDEIKFYVDYGCGDRDISGREPANLYIGKNKINKGINQKERNIIINLRLNEIIATFINIGHVGEKISYSQSKNYFLPKHLSEFEKLGLIQKTNRQKRKSEYIVNDKCMKISNKLISLSDMQPERELFMNNKLSSVRTINYLFQQIQNELMSILCEFDSFKFLFALIEEVNFIGRCNMMDILRYCIVNGYEDEFLWIFIGHGASGGKKAIRNGKDICIFNNYGANYNPNCSMCYKRYNVKNNNYIHTLLEIRDKRADKIYNNIINRTDPLEILLEEPIVFKFLLRFGITYYNKNILRAIGLLDSQVYAKSNGEYCPFIDEWRMKNEV